MSSLCKYGLNNNIIVRHGEAILAIVRCQWLCDRRITILFVTHRAFFQLIVFAICRKGNLNRITHSCSFYAEVCGTVGHVRSNAISLIRHSFKLSINGNISSGHLEGCFSLFIQGQRHGLGLFTVIVAVSQAALFELIALFNVSNSNDNFGILRSLVRIYGNSSDFTFNRIHLNCVLFNLFKLCADSCITSRHCKGVGVSLLRVGGCRNSLLFTLIVSISSLYATCFHSITGCRGSHNGNGSARSDLIQVSFGAGDLQRILVSIGHLDLIGLCVLRNIDGHIAVRHGEGVNRLSLFGGSLGCGFVLRCFLNFIQSNFGIAALCGNGNDIGAFLFYGQGNGIVLDVGVAGGAQGQLNAFNCIGQGNGVGGAFGCGMAIRAQVHIFANGSRFQLVLSPGMALGPCVVSVHLFTLGQAVRVGAGLGVSGGIAPCFNGNIGGCAAAQVADHGLHIHALNQVSAPHELFVLVLLVRAAHVLVVSRVVVPGLVLVALTFLIRSAGGIGLNNRLAIGIQLLIGVGQVGADRNDQLILGGADAGGNSLLIPHHAVAVTQGQASQRMVLEGSQILHTVGILGAIHDNHAHAGKVGIGNHVAVLILSQLNAAMDGVVFLHFFHYAGGRVHTVDGVVDVEVQLAIIQCGRVYQCGVDPICSSVCQALGVQVRIRCTGIDLIDGASFGQNLGIAVVIIEVAAGFLQIVVVHQDDIIRVIRLGKAAHVEVHAAGAAGILFADIVVRSTRTCFQSIGALVLHLLHELLHLGVVTRAAGTRVAAVAVLGLLAAHVVIQVVVGRGINVIEVIIVEVDGAADRGEPGILVAGILITMFIRIIRPGVRVMRLAVVHHNIAGIIHIGFLVFGVGAAIVQ